MDDQTQQPNDTPSSEGSNRAELVGELKELGRQLESAARAFVAGPGQTIRREIGEGLQELGQQMQRAVSAVQERPQTAELEQKARSAAQRVQASPVVQEIEDTVVSGLQRLNQQLRQLVERIEKQDDPDAPQAPTTQRLTVEQEDEDSTPPNQSPLM
jgi:hypothetical protein